ncbi:hypothetical protein R4Y45_00155 [Holzapfeliella sp. He02]|uniref:Uncharacterized protein n=1 Tax=Holzapfeliella saturejae TaxID=3082953 RepID=A0ABU8SEF0_9LACO
MGKRVSLVAYLESKVKQFEKRQAQKSPYWVFFVQNLRRATLLYLGLLIVDFVVAIANQHEQPLIQSLMGFHVEVISRNPFKYHMQWTTKMLLCYLIVLIIWFTAALLIKLKQHQKKKA